MRFNDAIVGLVLVIFAIAEITYSTGFPTLHGQAYGPSLFPILIGCGLLACGLVLIVRGLYARRPLSGQPKHSDADAEEGAINLAWIKLGDWAGSRTGRTDMLLVPGLLLAYILLSDTIGFIPVSIAILSMLLYRFSSSLTASLAIAITTTIVLQVVFAKVLLVPLPSGLLLRWLG